MQERFRKFAQVVSFTAGQAWVFCLAILIVVVWAITGPLFHYSDTWQLVINTGTTIVTFLMVFLIQNAQNRDGRAIQLKLDELIRAVGPAKNSMMDLNSLSDEQIERLEAAYLEICKKSPSEEEKNQAA